MKDLGIAYLLWLPGVIGIAGLQRLYIGKIFTGLLYFFTFGLFGFGTLVDLFTLPSQVDHYNLRNKT